jgi:hypothetical protein
LSPPNGLQNNSAELFRELAGRGQIGKAPAKIALTFSNHSPAVPRLNFSRPVKLHDPAAEFDIQFIAGNDKVHDVRIFFLVCDRFSAMVVGAYHARL